MTWRSTKTFQHVIIHSDIHRRGKTHNLPARAAPARRGEAVIGRARRILVSARHAFPHTHPPARWSRLTALSAAFFDGNASDHAEKGPYTSVRQRGSIAQQWSVVLLGSTCYDDVSSSTVNHKLTPALLRYALSK